MESVNMFKAGLVCHREDDQEAVSCPHVLLPHRTELLLAGCVQHCQDGGTQMYYSHGRVSLLLSQHIQMMCRFDVGFEHPGLYILFE